VIHSTTDCQQMKRVPYGDRGNSGALLMFLRILGEATSVIEMPSTATKTLTKPKIASLVHGEVDSLLVGWPTCMGAALVTRKNISRTDKTRKAMLGGHIIDWSTLTELR
jgi:hypothetical protein